MFRPHASALHDSCGRNVIDCTQSCSIMSKFASTLCKGGFHIGIKVRFYVLLACDGTCLLTAAMPEWRKAC
jgi:hypothetical protein